MRRNKILQEVGQEIEQEAYWATRQSLQDLSIIFIDGLGRLESLLGAQVPPMQQEILCKICYSHSVTLLETYISDTVISLISKDDACRENALRKVSELKDKKISLVEALRSEFNAQTIILTLLQDIVYHNVAKAEQILGEILGQPLKTNKAEIIKIVNVRHNIVHRNGKTKDGAPLSISVEDAKRAIAAVCTYQEQLRGEIRRIHEKNV